MKRVLTLGLVGLFSLSALAACSSDDDKSTVTAVKTPTMRSAPTSP